MEEPRVVEQINGGEEGEEFYEAIEAPKFVDFTAPDHYLPDDRFWFCSRVGCDQKHEEEMDPEAIYKSFVMRVMAARSPNVRLHRASRNVKCPLTAPPKSSKSRISRAALISSISKKMVDAKVKARPHLNKISATPNSKAKHSSALEKSLTTPRNRKLPANPTAFLTVQNPKAVSVAEPKTRTVAKHLIFNSPKKNARRKTSIELNTPVRKICVAMKKLEITKGNKHALGNGKPLPLDVSRKKLRGREVKSRVFDSLNSYKYKDQDTKSPGVLKRKNERNGIQKKNHVHPEGVEDGCSDMEIDEKSRGGSLEGCTLSTSSKIGSEELHKIGQLAELQLSENKADLSVVSINNVTSLSSSGKKVMEETDVCRIQAEREVEDLKNDNGDHTENIVSDSVKVRMPELMKSDDNENIVEADDKENGCRITENDEKENGCGITENDEKENAGPAENRESNPSNGECERLNIGKPETSKNIVKVKGALKKTMKENMSLVSGPQVLKHNKFKPTNPKPFRLRTDERGILREANMEKKLHCPSKDLPTFQKLHEEHPQRKHNYKIQKGEKCNRETHTEEGCEKKLDSKSEEDQLEGKVASSTKTPKPVGRKLPTKVLPKCKEMELEKSKDNVKKSKSDKMKQPFMWSRGETSSRKEKIASAIKRLPLFAIKETSSPNSQKEEAKPIDSAIVASACNTSRPSPQGRLLTIPKQPTFHSIHVPRSCTRKLV